MEQSPPHPLLTAPPSLLCFFFFFNIYLFSLFIWVFWFVFYFWLRWVFVVACQLLSSCGLRVFSLSSCGTQAPGRVGSVVCGMRTLLLRRASSVVVVRGLSCPVACGILVPRPGIEPTSPALEGRFFTTGPPGKSHSLLFLPTHPGAELAA